MAVIHIPGHERIIHLRAVRRLAMVALVHREDLKVFRQPQRDLMPVVRRTEQPMEQDDRPALSGCFKK
jgi:hypothetical protein